MTEIARRKRLAAARAIDAYGRDGQILKAVEELGELIVAIMHYRKPDGHTIENEKALHSEIADVEIMLTQLRIMFNSGGDVDDQISFKLARLERTLREKEGMGQV